jgi:hypothetical protein
MAREQTRGRDKAPDFPVVKIISPPLRLSYPKIFDPVQNDQGKDVWETDAFVPPNRDGKKFLKDLEDALFQVMEEYFGPEDEWPNGKKDGHPDEKIKWLKADDLPDALNEDWAKITARSYSQVGIVDADKNDVLNKREAYGGRWARLSLSVTVYDNKSKGPTIYLNNVQLLDNDESFGGRPAAERDFDTWDGEELAPGGRDRGRSRDRNLSGDSSEADERGRGRGDRSRTDGRRGDRSGSREDRDEGRSDREGSRSRRDSRGDDEGPSRGRDGVSSRGSDRGSADRDERGGRDRGAGRDTRDGGRASREDDSRGGGRERSRDRGRDDDEDRGGSRGRGRADAGSDGSRGARDDDDRGGRGRGRGRDQDEADDRDERPSGRGRGRDDADDDWN